jgi:hypothetical protein
MRGILPSAVVQAREIDPSGVIGGVQHDRSTLVMVTPSPGWLQHKLDDRAAFFKHDARARKSVQASCPKDLGCAWSTPLPKCRSGNALGS